MCFERAFLHLITLFSCVNLLHKHQGIQEMKNWLIKERHIEMDTVMRRIFQFSFIKSCFDTPPSECVISSPRGNVCGTRFCSEVKVIYNCTTISLFSPNKYEIASMSNDIHWVKQWNLKHHFSYQIWHAIPVMKCSCREAGCTRAEIHYKCLTS